MLSSVSPIISSASFFSLYPFLWIWSKALSYWSGIWIKSSGSCKMWVVPDWSTKQALWSMPTAECNWQDCITPVRFTAQQSPQVTAGQDNFVTLLLAIPQVSVQEKEVIRLWHRLSLTGADPQCISFSSFIVGIVELSAWTTVVWLGMCLQMCFNVH